VQFAIDRGNIEPFAFFLVALFLREFQNDRHERAAAFLGAAIALKIFPAAFLLLYLRPLRTKPIAQTLGIAALLTVGSFALLDRPILENAKRLLEILSSYESTSFNEGVLSARYSTSLRSMLDVVAATAPETVAEAAATLQSLPIGLLAGGALLGIATRIPVPQWGILAVAVSIMTLVPRTAADYRLIYWLLPLASFVREADDARPNRAMALLFGLLLIPKSLVLVGEVRIATVLNPVLAVALLAILVTTHSGLRTPASRTKTNASLDSGAS
jgi:hypothetical protein